MVRPNNEVVEGQPRLPINYEKGVSLSQPVLGNTSDSRLAARWY